MSSKHSSSKFAVVLTCLLAVLSSKTSNGQSLSNFVPVSPCRVLDTRNPTGPLGGPYMAGLSIRSFPIPSSSCGIPATASAYSMNVTVVPGGPLRYITVWPTGQTQPVVATMVSMAGQILSNAAIIPAGLNGAISVYTTDATNIIFDINGYFISPTNSANQSTAVGAGASSAGSQNTSLGFDALQSNNTGNGNTAVGVGVLSSNTSGNNNVALGTNALTFNATGSANTAVGDQAALNNLIGVDNTAVGFSSLWSNTIGTNNTVLGAGSAFSNSSGSYNVAVGESALYANTLGSWNVAIGYQAGNLISAGSNNIDIANPGASGDSNTIRIGTSGTQMSTYVAGINGVTISSGTAVLINSNGQLGTLPSSRRYKDDIQDMGNASDGLMKLHPVTFRYKQAAENGAKPLQYGLIAEEVAKVYPDLVVYRSDGEIESVEYHELPALLLNELQKQHKTIEEQERALARDGEQIEQQRREINDLEQHLKALDSALAAVRK